METKEYESLQALHEDMNAKYKFPVALVPLVDSIATEGVSPEFPQYMRSPTVNEEKFITAFSHASRDDIYYTLVGKAHVKSAKYYDGTVMGTVERPDVRFAIYQRHKVFEHPISKALRPADSAPAVDATAFVEGKVPEKKEPKTKGKRGKK